MEPGTKRRAPRPETAADWWGSLSARPGTTGKPSRALAATLALAALVSASSMPLVWHHLLLPNPAFYGPPTLDVLNGVSADSWLIAVAAVATGLAVRSLRQPPTTGLVIALGIFAFATVDGMFIDYFDWSRRGVSLDTPAFYGPGFFVGLAGAGLLVVAAVVAWRTRDEG